MGHMQMLGFMKSFYVFYPMFIIVIAAGTLFEVGTRIMTLFGIPSFLHEDELTTVS